MGRTGTELTATERRLAARAARGARNAEIARDVGLSVRTVEWHLSRVYRKLELRSRTELAVRLAKPGVRARRMSDEDGSGGSSA